VSNVAKTGGTKVGMQTAVGKKVLRNAGTWKTEEGVRRITLTLKGQNVILSI